jgi:hypothetical protein
VTLSRPQLDRLRSAAAHPIFTVDINRGNERRTYASLFKLGLLDWDPILQGRVKVTALGEQKLAEARAQKLAARAAIHLDRPGTLRIKDVGDRRVITLTGEHEEQP